MRKEDIDIYEINEAFAVVAGEVRNLASRSAESLKQIRTMIESNDDQVLSVCRPGVRNRAARSRSVSGARNDSRIAFTGPDDSGVSDGGDRSIGCCG